MSFSNQTNSLKLYGQQMEMKQERKYLSILSRLEPLENQQLKAANGAYSSSIGSVKPASQPEGQIQPTKSAFFTTPLCHNRHHLGITSLECGSARDVTVCLILAYP